MIPAIVIRPQPGCDATVAAAQDLGLDARGFPLFAVSAVAWQAPEPAEIDALLIGSANALRHGEAAIETYRGKPAYAVGKASAEAAGAAGLEVIAAGEGGLQGMLGDLRPEHRRLLRLAGKAHVDLEAPAGVTIVERIVYASDPLPLPPGLAAILREPAVVALHSGEAARHFAALCDANGIDRATISLAAIGPRVAEAAGHGWRAVKAATRPNDAALLALTHEMCQTADGSRILQDKGLMQDATVPSQDPVVDQTPPPPPPLVMPVRRRSAKTILATALVAFAIGAGLAGWLVWHGDLDRVLPKSDATMAPARIASSAPQAESVAAAPAIGQAPPELGGVETRLALLEERFSRIDQAASAASANASRAEALLIALATRRTIDRGEPLGYLEYQLKLRFGGAQSQAVQTIIASAKDPVTLNMLRSRLQAAAPALSGERTNESTWTRVSREFSNLFVVRRASSLAARPLERAERAQVLLTAGRIGDAIAEVERLPGAQDAQDWIASARRYDDAQRALDVIETAAMLQPRDLRDGEGLTIDRPSALAPPSEKAAPEEVTSEKAPAEKAAGTI